MQTRPVCWFLYLVLYLVKPLYLVRSSLLSRTLSCKPLYLTDRACVQISLPRTLSCKAVVPGQLISLPRTLSCKPLYLADRVCTLISLPRTLSRTLSCKPSYLADRACELISLPHTPLYLVRWSFYLILYLVSRCTWQTGHVNWSIYLVLYLVWGTGMIASSSTFRPHLGRFIRDLFCQLHAVWHGTDALQQSSKGSCSLLVSGHNLRADCQWRTLVLPLNCSANAALASVLALV